MVDRTWIDTDALMHDWIILIAVSALATEAVDRNIARFALAVESIWVKDFINIASVAVSLWTVLYFNCRFAARAGVRHHYCCQEE